MTYVKNSDITPELLINLKHMYLETNVQKVCEAQVRVLKWGVKLIKEASKKLECYVLNSTFYLSRKKTKKTNNDRYPFSEVNSSEPLSKKAVTGNSSQTNSFTDENHLVDQVNAIALGGENVKVDGQRSSIIYYYKDFEQSISSCYQKNTDNNPEPPSKKKRSSSVYKKPEMPKEIINENDIIKSLCEITGDEYRPDQYDLVSFVNFYAKESRSMLKELKEALISQEISKTEYTEEIEKLYNIFHEIQKVINENKEPLYKGVLEKVNITLKDLSTKFSNITDVLDVKNQPATLSTINLQKNRGMMR